MNHLVFKSLYLSTLIIFSVACTSSGIPENSDRYEIATPNTSNSINDSWIEDTDLTTQSNKNEFNASSSDIALEIIELIELVQKSNNFYIHGDMQAWLETFFDLSVISENNPLKNFEGTLSYNHIGYQSQQELEAHLASLIIFLAYANYFTHEEDLESSLSFFNHAIEINASQLSAAYSGRGHIHRLQDNPTMATQDFETAINLNDENADAYRGLALLALSKNDYPTALKYLEQALVINPTYGRAYALIGDIKYDLEDYDDALNNYKKALEYDPYYEDLYIRLAWYQYKKGNYSDCLSAVKEKELVTFNGESLGFVLNGYDYYISGLCKERLGQFDATSDLRKAVELEPLLAQDVSRAIERINSNNSNYSVPVADCPDDKVPVTFMITNMDRVVDEYYIEGPNGSFHEFFDPFVKDETTWVSLGCYRQGGSLISGTLDLTATYISPDYIPKAAECYIFVDGKVADHGTAVFQLNDTYAVTCIADIP